MLTATLPDTRIDARPAPATSTDTVPPARDLPRPALPAPAVTTCPEVTEGRWRRMLRRLTSTHEPVPPMDGGPLALRDVRDAQVRDLGYHARLL